MSLWDWSDRETSPEERRAIHREAAVITALLAFCIMATILS